MPDNSPRFDLKDWPFPHWTMTAILRSWQGLPSRRDLYGWRETPEASDGTAEIQLAPVRRNDDPPTEAEVAAVSWVIENEPLISDALIASLFKEYSSLQELYGYTGERRAELMPDIETADELRSLICLHTVYVHRTQKEGVPYSGFSFGCTWEPEHGLGILMHGSRTVKIGWADTAFDPVRKDDRGSVSGSLIVAPRRIPGWPPVSRKEGWINTSGIPLYHPSDDEFFRSAGAQFSLVGPVVSEAEIRAVFPEPFPGRDDLIQFYLRYNGGSRSSKGCIMHCGSPAHCVPRNELENLNLEGFRSIPMNADDRMLPFANMLAHHATMAGIYSQIPEMKAFLDQHMEIAFDHSGRDLCISGESGRVFFMDWTAYKKGPVEVASSFREFVERFWNIRLGPVH
jgi:hypothetical protein